MSKISTFLRSAATHMSEVEEKIAQLNPREKIANIKAHVGKVIDDLEDTTDKVIDEIKEHMPKEPVKVPNPFGIIGMAAGRVAKVANNAVINPMVTEFKHSLK